MLVKLISLAGSLCLPMALLFVLYVLATATSMPPKLVDGLVLLILLFGFWPWTYEP